MLLELNPRVFGDIEEDTTQRCKSLGCKLLSCETRDGTDIPICPVKKHQEYITGLVEPAVEKYQDAIPLECPLYSEILAKVKQTHSLD